ncbi:MAG: gamma-glutamyltransferase [Sinobacteraceae bacterium]|nr:gamma-glutamyltransferase [Nevskiaceae bacterium]
MYPVYERRPRAPALLRALASLFVVFACLPQAGADPTPDFSAPRGDRASGWLGQTRSEVLARNGVVATSQPLAAQAGLQILKSGGNAFDAAVATAAVMNVVEPGSAGIGGDVFVIAWLAKEKKLIALNGSGRAPSGATLEHITSRARGAKEMPQHGIDTATVPGAVDAWDVLLKRAGTLTFKEVLEPAAILATQGFGVSERIHHDWIYGAEVLSADAESVHTYLVNGQPPPTYSLFRNPDLAHAFRVLQKQGRSAFYDGEIARAIVKKSSALGGTMTLQDLHENHATWEEPISTNYHGYDVYEFPPNTQGFATLEMLNILEMCASSFGVDLGAAGPASPVYWHLLVEAKKLAYEDLYAFNADPAFATIPVARLISKDYAKQLCARIDLRTALTPQPRGDPVGGTVYLATADRWGNLVSFIYSVYDTFGSGITIPGYGFVLNDRGALFSLNPKSPNVIAPHKRPFHTILPGFLMKDGKPVMAFGLMGGSQQAQGHAQVLVSMIDLGANPQAASDAARFSHAQATNTLYLESGLFTLVGAPLSALGHRVVVANGDDMGGFQAIQFMPYPPAPAAAATGGGSGEIPINGVYRAASDHRKDGEAVGW